MLLYYNVVLSFLFMMHLIKHTLLEERKIQTKHLVVLPWTNIRTNDANYLIHTHQSYELRWLWQFITLTKSITMFCGTDNVLQIIPNIQVECGNIPQKIVNPIEHCYEYKQCYVQQQLIDSLHKCKCYVSHRSWLDMLSRFLQCYAPPLTNIREFNFYMQNW